MKEKPCIGILLGDGSGVGPEIVAKCAASHFFEEHCRPLLIGDKRIFERAMEVCGVSDKVDYEVCEDIDSIDWKKNILLYDTKDLSPEEAPFGEGDKECGASSLHMLRLSVEFYNKGVIEGFCFAPFNKATMHDAGCMFESEHHYLADLLKHTEPFGEINVVDDMWTARTTSHIPISQVSENITVERISRAIRLSDKTLKNAGIKEPRIGVAGLNPHCGEHGNCGREEIDVIEPAIEKMREEGINALGPYPSDIVFYKGFNGEFDGVVTMYHDQGQIALKLKGFERGITIAGGFDIPIVTCGHGTAYDIAGKGIVKTGAFENAVKMCARMANAKKGA